MRRWEHAPYHTAREEIARTPRLLLSALPADLQLRADTSGASTNRPRL
jgi:hypothetical protein